MKFESIRVIELANVLAGPAVGMFFTELGAQVIKIENRNTGGDMTRKWKLPEEAGSDQVSAYFSSVNWGKEHRFADLSAPDEQQQIYELIREADVVITNFKPGAAERLGMDETTLRNTNPSLIYAALTGFGRDDRRTAYDVVLQAESGYLSMTGTPDSGPVKMPVAMIDLLAAHQLKEGILVALLKRESTGKGALVEASLYDSALASLANQASNWLMAGHRPGPMGTRHPNIAPYGDLFATRDGKQIVLAIGTESQFKGLCQVLLLPDLMTDERFQTNAVRVINRDALAERLQQAIDRFDRDDLLDQLLNNAVPVGAVRALDEVFENPAAQQLILEEEVNGGNTRRVKTAVFSITERD